MFIKAVKRFNHHDVGEVFDADIMDAKFWIMEGLAKKAVEPMAKTEEGPAADKAIKEPDKKK